MSSSPTFTLSEAVEACTCSRSTLRRKLKAGEIDGATQNNSGQWQIPISALVTAGLMASTSPPEEPTEPAESSPTELDALKAENVELRKRAEIAEAIAQERERTIETQATALKMIEAAPAPLTSWNASPLNSTKPELTHDGVTSAVYTGQKLASYDCGYRVCRW